MNTLEQRGTELRAEIDQLKSALQVTTNVSDRFELHGRLNSCIRESLALIEQRLQAACSAGTTLLRERQVGKDE
jgi:hypothetical protein